MKHIYRLILVLALALAATAPALAKPDKPPLKPPAPIIECGGGTTCP
ncbi:MAG: hypothetical protein KIT87_04405 [Anaerolineae bacterium]|nr:hypothetical protein [Anaerolineae bacterium]